jgi:hypothetical protein
MSKPKHPTMPPSNHHLDEAVLHEVSLLCGVDTGLIDDVYGCTPFQRGIAADSSYVQRFVLTISADLDTADLSAAIGQVVALNQVLRTRIVDSQQLGLVQVVLHDDPATSTRRISTGLAQFLEEERATSMDLAAPLFRSTIVQDAQKWVLSIHHAICDQFSLIALVDDVTKIYCKQKPSFHTPFKQFVDYCGSIRQSERLLDAAISGYCRHPEHFPIRTDQPQRRRLEPYEPPNSRADGVSFGRVDTRLPGVRVGHPRSSLQRRRQCSLRRRLLWSE